MEIKDEENQSIIDDDLRIIIDNFEFSPEAAKDVKILPLIWLANERLFPK